MLQTGAFQQEELAYQELERQLALGIKAIVRQEDFPGRTLYLVQSGPYSALRELSEAEQLLQKHNIQSMRMSLQ
jgi:cell division protein FtsN